MVGGKLRKCKETKRLLPTARSRRVQLEPVLRWQRVPHSRRHPVRPATRSEISRWDELVVANPDGGHVLQTRAWGEFKRSWGWRPTYWIARAGDADVAVLFLRRRYRGLGELWYAPKGPGVTESAALAEVLSDHESMRSAFVVKVEPEIEEWRADTGAWRAAGLRKALVRRADEPRHDHRGPRPRRGRPACLLQTEDALQHQARGAEGRRGGGGGDDRRQHRHHVLADGRDARAGRASSCAPNGTSVGTGSSRRRAGRRSSSSRRGRAAFSPASSPPFSGATAGTRTADPSRSTASSWRPTCCSGR